MSEVKFGVNEQPVTPPATEPAAPVSVPAVQTPVAVPAQSGLLLGDKLPDFTEIILPRLNIVQNLGDLRQSFELGSLVFNQQVAIYIPGKFNEGTKKMERDSTPPVNLTVLGFKPTRYVEKTVGGARGLNVGSEAEVRAAGGTLDYGEWKLKEKAGMKRFEYLADALVAIECPEWYKDEGAIFSYPAGGKQYALALWAMHGTVYTEAAKKVFFTHRRVGCLREGGYPTWAYAVSTREKAYPNGNKSWIPVCIPARKSTPEFLAFVRSVISAPTADAQE